MKILAFYVIKITDEHSLFITNSFELSFVSFVKKPFVK